MFSSQDSFEGAMPDFHGGISLAAGRRAVPGAISEASSWIAEGSPDGLLVIDGHGTIQYLNRAARDITGYTDDSIIGKSVEELVPHEVRHRHAGMREGFTGEHGSRQMGTLMGIDLIRADGERTPVDIALNTMSMAGETYTIAAIRDDSVRRDLVKADHAAQVMIAEAERELRAAAQMFEAGFYNSASPNLLVDADGIVLQVNAALWRMVGRSASAVTGKHWQTLLHPDSQSDEAFDQRTADGEHADVEVQLATGDGGKVTVLINWATVTLGDPRSDRIANMLDITARREAERALHDQAVLDELTGLHNRRALHDRASAALRSLARTSGIVTLLFCDLDRFKEVNDSMGHKVGDLLLIEITKRLSMAVRPGDVVARLGGDEFVILAENLYDPADAEFLAHRLQQTVSVPWFHDGNEFRPSMSIGVTMTQDPHMSVDELLRRGDAAMYRAKDLGRDRFEVYDHEVDRDIQRAVNLQQDLRKAIDNDGLLMHYQPIVNLIDGSIIAAEALVRIRGTNGGAPILPDKFVPQAERSGLVLPLGVWTVQRALADLRAWRDQGSKCGMSINVSPVQFRNGAFAAFLLREAEAAGLDPATLSVEVTETTFIQDPHGAAQELAMLERAGISISLDDFGTGYSSLSWLTDFPVDAVKIDKSFIAELGRDPRKTAVVSALINVAHELGVRVVAEGIETEEQSARLLELGCTFGQGYLFSRPVEASHPMWW